MKTLVWLLVCLPWERGHPARRRRGVRARYNGIRIVRLADRILVGRMVKQNGQCAEVTSSPVVSLTVAVLIERGSSHLSKATAVAG